MTFNGFISYSHAADGQLAPAVQRGLHRLAKPWHRRRALWIFRDQTGLAVTPALWTSIQKALDGSEYFVLLASPEAASSPWVNREIEHWVATKSADRVLPVVTDGHWQWDPALRDFTADSTAVPAALRGAFTEEPLYLDLRWARNDQHLSLRHSRFRDAIAQLAAPMHGVSKDDLEGEDVRQHRRARQLQTGALATLLVLALVAALTGGSAVRNAEHARTAAAEALRQQQAAFEQRGNAERSADEALRQQQLAEQQQARAVAATAETRRQEGLAGQQRALAQQAAADADRQEQLARDQRSLAELAATEADRQEKLAREQRASARRASADATHQQQIARQQRGLATRAQAQAQSQQRLAQRQRALAQKWAAEADLQQKSAQQQKLLAQDATREAGRQQRNAARQRDIAVGRRLLNEARAAIDSNPRTALMLGTAADRIQADAESRRQLAALVTSTRYASTLDGVHTLTFGSGAVAAGNDGDTFSLWNVADPVKPVRLATLDDSGASDTLAFSPNGRILAGVGSDGATVLWNVVNPKSPVRLGALPGLTDVSVLTFSPDGHTLFTGTFTDDLSTMGLWDVADPAHPRRLFTAERDNSAAAATFSSDGKTLVITDERMEVWDVADRAHPELLTTVESDTWKPTAFSPTRPVVVTETPTGVTGADVWDFSRPGQPEQIARLALPANPTALAFSVDGRTLAVGDELGTVTRWDLSDPTQPLKIDSVATNDGTVTAVSYRRDGRTLATSGNDGSTLWSAATYGAPVSVGELTLGAVSTTVTTAFRPDGRAMATAHGDGTAVFWDVSRPSRPARRATATIHGDDVEVAAFSRDLRTVAAAGLDRKVTLTDVSDPRRPKALATIAVPAEAGFPSSVGFSPDGRTLAVAAEDGVVTLWDLTDRAAPRRLVTMDLPDPVAAAVFGPDGRTLALTHRGGKVVLWNVANRSAPVRLSQVGFSWWEPAGFSLTRRLLVTRGSALQTAALWDVADPAKPRRLATLNGHVDTFMSAAFSPDGRMVAMATQDGMVTVWDIAEPTKPLRLATMGPDLAAGTTLAFSPDGHTLAATVTYRNHPGRVTTLWDYTALKNVRDHADRVSCAIAGRGLTADEWARYVPELAYRRTCTG